MTSDKSTHLSFAVFNNFAQLWTTAIRRGSEDDNTQIQLRPLAAFRVSLAFLEQGELDLGGLQHSQQSTALMLFGGHWWQDSADSNLVPAKAYFADVDAVKVLEDVFESDPEHAIVITMRCEIEIILRFNTFQCKMLNFEHAACKWLS